MDTLKKLVTVLSSLKPNLSYHSISTKKNSKMYRFYKGILHGQIKTDTDALQLLYNRKPEKNTYYKLKSDLKNKLTQIIISIDLNVKHSKSSNKYLHFHLKRELQKIKTLEFYGISTKESKIIKLLEKAQYYTFPKITIEFALILIRHHVYKDVNLDKSKKYWQLIHENQSLVKLELISSDKFNTLISYYTKSKSNKKFISTLADQFIQELGDINLKFESARFITYYYGIFLIKYMSNQNYVMAIRYGEIALNKLRGMKLPNLVQKGFFLNNLVVCDIGLKRFTSGKNRIKALQSLKLKGTNSWFSTNEVGISLSLYTKNYNEAYLLFHEAFSFPTFKNMKSTTKDKWYIIQAYINFLIISGNIQIPSIDDPFFKNFKIEKFFNNMEIYHKDKSGLYITIWIGYLINLFATKQDAKILSKEEAFSKYVSRYLSIENNYRSFIFCKMLLLFIKSDFDLTAIKTEIEEYKTILTNTPPLLSNQEHDIEIMPYEDLWEILIGIK